MLYVFIMFAYLTYLFIALLSTGHIFIGVVHNTPAKVFTHLMSAKREKLAGNYIRVLSATHVA